MAPPDDSDKDHGCAWRDFAVHLQGEVQTLKAQVEVLARAFAKKSEKTGRLPKIARPPRTAEEAADRRTEQALLRAERMETKQERVAVPEADKRCASCGGTSFRPVGPGKTCEVFEYVPGYLRRIVLTRETVACRCGGCVLTAPPPARWAEKTRYASSFVAQPLRQPLFDVLRNDFLVHADETAFKMTKQASKAFLWAFVGHTLTGYRFDLSRSGDVPVDVLGDSVGAILCDDYRGYDPLVRRGKRRRCGCLAHARRHFFNAGDVPEAKEALSLVAGMYRVEHEAERRGIVGTPAHLTLRRELARPLYVRLLLLARETRRAHAPKTLLGRAARYTWRNQAALGRFLKDARILLDNNRAENAMRLVALGRKNFLFVHSEEAGKELALLYSLVVSCTRVGVNPVEYLADVLGRVGGITDADDLAALLPHRWKPPPKSGDPVDFDA